ncbi:phosphoribosyltransferase [Streptomyces sp. NBC_01142]|uniref:phosphoribosyltransferase n=1 Tax=Streptomyces sp. NBC_01142 TaxID=2975865 RepID=UPI00225249B8|nr:phosphoribosyltransferase [Streptomyces sp. NBC_01142]MCX4826451.1 phosphoribosyltransferase [Streptomyces sp. NBC_01142]
MPDRPSPRPSAEVPASDLVFTAAAGRRSRMVSWLAYQQMAADVAGQIRRAHPGAVTLVGILQGGWITAQSLADLLPASTVLAAAARRRGERTDGLELLAAADGLLAPGTLPQGQPLIVVDEVVDSGRTARFFLGHLALYEPQLACLAASDTADPAPHFTAWSMSDLPALVLPWRVLRDADQTAACLLAAGPLTTAQLDERLRDLGHDIDPVLLEFHLDHLAARDRLHRDGDLWLLPGGPDGG